MIDAGRISPEGSVFVLFTFEGPDAYSQAGGLGVRMTGLAHTLAHMGYETHVFFIGDPQLPGEEFRMDGRLVLHRWCQWISANAPGGVYDNEEAKLADYSRSAPGYALDRIIVPALASGKTPVVLLEEWQTAETACRLAEALRDAGLRDRVVMLWNANNPYGFDRIDWHRLGECATITAVSRYMRSIIRAKGADAVVIPNGISAELLEPVSRAEVAPIRTALAEYGASAFFKMARWEREKGWTQALQAVLRARDDRQRLIVLGRAGGPTGAGGALVHEAETLGLRATQVNSEPILREQWRDIVRSGVDVVSLGFGVSFSFARSLYAATDGVLANSVSEPFGLVGLEAMAAGGIAYTGGTGEDYAVTGRNAIVLQTLDPGEILHHWTALSQAPERRKRLRRFARMTARRYTWASVVTGLLGEVERQAMRQMRSRPVGVVPAEWRSPWLSGGGRPSGRRLIPYESPTPVDRPAV